MFTIVRLLMSKNLHIILSLHFLFLVSPSQSLQQVLKVFLLLDGLRVTWASDCRLSLAFFFTSLQMGGKTSLSDVTEGNDLTLQPSDLLPGQMKNGLDDVGSFFSAGFAEQGSVCLQAQGGHPRFNFDTRESGRLRQLFLIGWRERLLTLANFSPCKLLTLVPSGCCSRRSTLFPTTHIEILSSADSWAKKKRMQVGQKNACSLGEVMFMKRAATNGE